jgi:hypothetical protein
MALVVLLLHIVSHSVLELRVSSIDATELKQL